ncbi:VOC family protein [Sinimarinibacterium flocculans]|uniref:Putative glyoxalase superfamily protein PhnB n=1 Tax=Sinimarinibacterium flocculans TaxID=985250 RepID=A0A318E6G7_9GAMM|nr:VOC family protein [Sinimarinibacterium flocculans]PXV66246.1 putative glyoxalase superfamily protein PhnB [Sinimarinibacterium flocculans]
MIELIANIDVDDLSAALAFYVDGLGLTVRRRFGDFGVELSGASSSVFLLVKPAGTTPAPGSAPRDYRRHWTPVHLDFVVDDVDAAAARAVRAGARLEGEVRTHRWGRVAHLADPFGHGVCLIQFLNRGYDEVADP